MGLLSVELKESFADENAYATGSGDEGLVNTYAYYTAADVQSDPAGESSAGAVVDYLKSSGVAEGLNGSTVVTTEYDYYAHTANSYTTYHTASRTTYENTNQTGAAVTSYSYDWYSSLQQMRERKTTLPAVSTAENGSNAAADRFEFFDTKGNLTWTADENGRFTHYIYDSQSGNLLTTIEDIDAGDGYSLPSTTLSGWPSLPASGQGASGQTDYEYDGQGRLVQTLGPAHTADLSGTPTSVRTASWEIWGREIWGPGNLGSGNLGNLGSERI